MIINAVQQLTEAEAEGIIIAVSKETAGKTESHTRLFISLIVYGHYGRSAATGRPRPSFPDAMSY